MESESLFFKQLKLISPELAYHKYSLKVEAPIFVSPFIQRERSCDCKVDYSPLIYKVDSIVEAQHFHRESGGIYYYETDCTIDLKDFISSADHLNIQPFGWFAAVKPLGETFIESKIEFDSHSLISRRSEAVVIEKIQAFCVAHKQRHEITDGALIDSWWISDRLCPVCPETHPREEIDFWSMFYFQNEDYLNRKKAYKFHLSERGNISFYYPN